MQIQLLKYSRIVDIIRVFRCSFRIQNHLDPSFSSPWMFSKEREKHNRLPFLFIEPEYSTADAYRHDSHEYLLYDSCNFWTMNLRGHGRVAFNWRTLIPILWRGFFFHCFDTRRNGKKGKGGWKIWRYSF